MASTPSIVVLSGVMRGMGNERNCDVEVEEFRSSGLGAVETDVFYRRHRIVWVEDEGSLAPGKYVVQVHGAIHKVRFKGLSWLGIF
jgi:hypothetical protein